MKKHPSQFLPRDVWGCVWVGVCVGGGVRPSSQNPYPVYPQNLHYSLPYLWPDQKFETLFMILPLHQNPVSDLGYN